MKDDVHEVGPAYPTAPQLLGIARPVLSGRREMTPLFLGGKNCQTDVQ